MKLFTMDSDNNIVVYATADDAPANEQLIRFSSEKDLARAAKDWPTDRLAEIWNSFAGVAPFTELKPVKKFTDRKTAVARIWKAVQRLEAPVPPDVAPQAATAAPKPRKRTKGTPAAKKAAGAREGSKKAIILDLLRRSEGATLKEIMGATNWQAHSVRGFISAAVGKKMGLKVESTRREDGERLYHLA